MFLVPNTLPNTSAVDALERLVTGPEPPGRKLLLCECVQAYAPLEDDQRIELTTLLNAPEKGVGPVIKTWTEEAEERGLNRGLRQMARAMLEAKFGPLSEEVLRRLTVWPAERLEDLGRALLTAQSLGELGLEEEQTSA
jgi:hypothetical protein